MSLAHSVETNDAHKQRSQLHVEDCGDLRLKLTNLEPNINYLVKDQLLHFYNNSN